MGMGGDRHASMFVYTEGGGTAYWESVYIAYQATRCGNEGGTGLEASLSPQRRKTNKNFELPSTGLPSLS